MTIFELLPPAHSNRPSVDDSASARPAAGKPLPFPMIYRRYFQEVYRSIRRFGVAERHADDVTQDVFVAVHRALPRFDWSRRFAPWLKTIAYRVARDHRQAGKNNKEQLSITEGFDPLDAASEDREGRLAGARDALKELDAILQTLDDDERQVLVLCEIEECRVIDVAHELGLPDSTVSTRLQRARKRFDAALLRRRAAEEHRLGAARLLPLFLLDPTTLWGAARDLPEASPAAQARLWGRLVRATATSRATGVLSTLVGLAPAQLLGGALLATSLGALGGGAAVYTILRRPSEAVSVAVDDARFSPVAPRASPSRALVSAVRAEPEAAAPLPPTPTPTTAPTPTPTTAATAALSTKSPGDRDVGPRAQEAIDAADAGRKEMVLIDSARNALRTHHPQDALEVLARHARQFPRGVYQEERESLQQEARRALERHDP